LILSRLFLATPYFLFHKNKVQKENGHRCPLPLKNNGSYELVQFTDAGFEKRLRHKILNLQLNIIIGRKNP